MAASTHWLATATAQSVLERGGNAVDAAAAAAFVLHLVEPHLNGPGGDLTGLVALADDPRPRVLAGQGPAPRGATIAHYRAEGLTAVPGSGALAAAVPGAVDALLLLLGDHGSWELADVLAYVIEYAEAGYPLVEAVARSVAGVRPLFVEHWPSSADFWLDPARTDRGTNPAYASVLRRLLAAGQAETTREERIAAARREWCTGFVPREIAAFVARPHRHSTGTDHAGVLRPEDFAATGARWERPATLAFRGHVVVKAGPWSQGPTLLQALTLLDGLPDGDLDPGTARGVHHVVEALKLALADRDAYYGDPGGDDTPVPMAALLAPAYVERRRALIGPRASTELRPGELDGHRAFRPPTADRPSHPGAGTGEPTVAAPAADRGDTCHLDVVDRHGNMVTLTPSGGWLQSSPHVPAVGFCLGTRLQMTWLDPAAPSALRPGRRPRSTLSPTLVLRGGQPVLAFGTPGGDQQEQWQLPFLLRVLVGGYTPQQAIDAPTFHTTSRTNSFWPRDWTPGGLVVEDRLGEEVLTELTDRGHRVTRAGAWSLGRLSAVWRDPSSGELGAAADARSAQAYAAGR